MKVYSCGFSKRFIVLALTSGSLIHLELIFRTVRRRVHLHSLGVWTSVTYPFHRCWSGRLFLLHGVLLALQYRTVSILFVFLL